MCFPLRRTVLCLVSCLTGLLYPVYELDVEGNGEIEALRVCLSGFSLAILVLNGTVLPRRGNPVHVFRWPVLVRLPGRLRIRRFHRIDLACTR